MGFYKGLSANISRGIVLNATKLGTYDVIKTGLKTKFGFEGLPLHFFSAFTAGFFMTLTVTPFDMIRTRLMN
jgi:solute carrier family 25 protein 14/30